MKHVESVTSKAGWAPLPGGYKRLAVEFPTDQVVAVDKSSWDWTMPGWCVRAYYEVKRQQCRDWDDRYDRLVRARLYHVVGPGSVLRLADGAEFAQRDWGLMKSGWLLTLSMNSMSQLFQHAVAWWRLGNAMSALPHVWAMGDDTIIKYTHDSRKLELYESALATTGCLVKKSVLRREFCGVLVEGDDDVTVTPLYVDKHKFLLSYLDPKVEQDTLQSYFLLYALSKDRWVDEYRDRLIMDHGPMYKLWAKGLCRLQCFDDMPPWTAW